MLAPMSGPPVTLVLHDQLATLRQVAVSVEGETQRLLGLFSEGHDVLSRLGLVRGGAGNEKWYALQGMYSRNLHDLIRTRHVGELRCTVKWREKAAGAGATMPSSSGKVRRVSLLLTLVATCIRLRNGSSICGFYTGRSPLRRMRGTGTKIKTAFFFFFFF